MRHTLYLAVVLAIIWLANSGHYTGLILSLGVLSIAFVLWLARRMQVIDREAQPVHLTLNIPLYWAWLAKEIVLSNIDVVRRIWRGVDAISPTTVTLPMAQKTDVARVILANSITLTPGTVTLDVNDDQMVVHALTDAGARALAEGEMDRRVAQLDP